MPIPKVSVTAGSGTDLRFRPMYDGTGATVYGQVVDTFPGVETPVGTGGTRYIVNAATALPVGTATHAYVSVDPDGGSVRFWNTGGVPTTTLGHFLGNGAGPIEITNASQIQVAAAGTTGGTIQVSLHVYT